MYLGDLEEFGSKSILVNGRHKMKLISNTPPVLDIIKMESPLNITSTVQFVLNSGPNKSSKFQAGFSHDSASEFSVYPTTGVLESSKK